MKHHKNTLWIDLYLKNEKLESHKLTHTHWHFAPSFFWQLTAKMNPQLSWQSAFQLPSSSTLLSFLPIASLSLFVFYPRQAPHTFDRQSKNRIRSLSLSFPYAICQLQIVSSFFTLCCFVIITVYVSKIRKTHTNKSSQQRKHALLDY